MSAGEAPARDFRLSVTLALRDQLNATLESIEPAPLRFDVLDLLEVRGGVYELFLDGDLVYVGKANSDLPGRLRIHARKLAGRTGGLASRVQFRCVYVDEDLHAVSAERLLIDLQRAVGGVAWNTNGFGNKDPGKRRDQTTIKSDHFDALFPIDLDYPVHVVLPPGLTSLHAVALELKASLPYLWRFESTAAVSELLRGIELDSDEVPDTQSARSWFEWFTRRAPAGWVTIALPGYVISYIGINPDSYESRIGAWRRVDGVATYEPHEVVYDVSPGPTMEAGEDPDESPE